MNIITTKLEGVFVVEPKIYQDSRGFFMESFHQAELEAKGLKCCFVQDNQSLSVEVGVIRGLHYQLNPKAQTKLVRVLSGAISDVAVDLRKRSPTYGQWVGVILSEWNKRQLFVPKGFAHGFCTLTPNTQVHYKVDEYYSPEHERGIAWDDPELSIDWATSPPILSSKDQNNPSFRNAEHNFE
jgi:dTDP-4-dehydrorhamnose 3,5-epimerase